MARTLEERVAELERRLSLRVSTRSNELAHATDLRDLGDVKTFLDLEEPALTPRTPSADVLRVYAADENAKSRAYAVGDDGRALRLMGFRDARDVAFVRDEFMSASNLVSAGSVVSEQVWTLANDTISFEDINDVNHPGSLLVFSSAGAGTTSTIYATIVNSAGSFSRPMDADAFFDAYFIIDPVVFVTCNWRVGFTNSPAVTTSTDGIYFEKLSADTNWFGVCRAASVETRLTTGVAMAAGFVRLRIRRTSATNIAFTVNDGADVNIATNVPTAGLIPYVYMTPLEAVIKKFRFDYYDNYILLSR